MQMHFFIWQLISEKENSMLKKLIVWHSLLMQMRFFIWQLISEKENSMLKKLIVWHSLLIQKRFFKWQRISEKENSVLKKLIVCHNLLMQRRFFIWQLVSEKENFHDAPKAVWTNPYVSVAFFPSLKPNFIAYLFSKMSSRPDCIFEIHQLWQSGFSRVYSNRCCNCHLKRCIAITYWILKSLRQF